MELRKRDRIRLPGRYTSDQLYGDVDFITAPRDSGVNASAKHRTSAQPVHDDSPPNEPNPSGISSSRLAHLRSRALNMRCTNDGKNCPLHLTARRLIRNRLLYFSAGDGRIAPPPDAGKAPVHPNCTAATERQAGWTNTSRHTRPATRSQPGRQMGRQTDFNGRHERERGG